MKIYFDLAKKCLKEVDTENQVIFTGDVLVSKLEVISSAPTTDYYVVVSAKLSNGRTIGPFLYDAGGVESDSHCTKWTFTLSSANGFTLTKGIVNFYVWLVPVNANDLNKKCIGAVAVNVGEAYGFEDSYFVELDSESQDVIANMSAQIHQLQTLIQNVNIIEPNPSSEATTDLNTIKIGSVTYRITQFQKFSENDTFGEVIDEFLEQDAPPFTAIRHANLICEETGAFIHLEGYQSGADTYVEIYIFGSDIAHLICKNPNSTILNYTMSQIIQGTTATSVASLTDLKNEVVTLGATKENKKIDYIIYVTETYNQQTQEFEFTKTGEYGTFPFLFDDESNIDDLRKDLECLRVCIYVDTTRTSHAGQNIDVIELSLHRLSHPDDDSSTSAVFVGQQISGTNTTASIYQFEVDFCQDGMSDGGTENIDRYTLFNYKELHYVHTDNNFTNAYKTAVTKQGYDSSTDTFTPTAKINASNVDVTLDGSKTMVLDDTFGYAGHTLKNLAQKIKANEDDIDSLENDIDSLETNLSDNYYTKTQVDNKVSTVYKYKGSVSNYSDLPSSGQQVGDTYNIANADSTHGIKAGDNVAWNGTAWDPLAGTVDLSGYQTKIDSSHKLSSDLVDDSSSTHKFVTDADKLAWSRKQNALTFDTTPTSGSTNPVESGGIHSAIDSARQQATQDAVNILTSDNSFVQANLGATPMPESIVELNGDLYSLWGVNQRKFNENTKQWEDVSIPIGANVSFARADILGGRIFKIGNSYYCAFNDATKGVAYLTSQMHWVQGASNVVFDGATVWTDGTDTYAFVGNVSNADDAIIYRIVEGSNGNLTLTDVTDSFTNIPTNYGGHKIALTKQNIWHDLSGNTYLSYGKTYKLIANSRTFDTREYFYGRSIAQGNYVWNDGQNVFLTNGNTYALNFTTEEMYQVPIAGMESMNPNYGMWGNRIWKDLSGNVYYVDNSLNQYALVKSEFVDQAYDPTSKNAQSGIAVEEAVAEAKAEIEENFTEASADITDTTTYKVSGSEDNLALPKKSQVEIVKVEGNSVKAENVFDYGNVVSYSGGTISYDDLGISLTNVSANGDFWLTTMLTANTTYTLNFSNTTNIENIRLYDSLQGSQIKQLTIANTITFTTIQNCYLRLWVNYNTTFSGSITMNKGSEPYFEGIHDADTTELESCGINIWDEEWEVLYTNYLFSKNYIKVKENTTYYYKNSSVQTSTLYFYDSSKNQLSTLNFATNGTFTTPLNCEYIKFSFLGTTYNHDICINYSNASINGNYYQHTHDSVNVGSDVLRSVNDVRDTKLPNGMKNIKVGVIDLSTLNFTQDSSNRWIASLSTIYNNSNPGAKANILCDKYETKTANETYLGNIGISSVYQEIEIYDTSITQASDITGTLYYELATPTTEQGTPFSSNALAVEMYGAEWQNGTIPLQVTKNYDISIKDQVLTNVEVDKKQSEQIKELQKLFEPTLLWSNSNPSSDFAGQTLTIPTLPNYKYIVIVFKTDDISYTMKFTRTNFSPITNNNEFYSDMQSINVTNGKVVWRMFYSSEDSLTFDSGYPLDSDTPDDSACVPIKIYGTDIL